MATEVILAVRWGVPLEPPAGLSVPRLLKQRCSWGWLKLRVWGEQVRGAACAGGVSPSNTQECCAPLLVWQWGGSRDTRRWWGWGVLAKLALNLAALTQGGKSLKASDN